MTLNIPVHKENVDFSDAVIVYDEVDKKNPAANLHPNSSGSTPLNLYTNLSPRSTTNNINNNNISSNYENSSPSQLPQ